MLPLPCLLSLMTPRLTLEWAWLLFASRCPHAVQSCEQLGGGCCFQTVSQGILRGGAWFSYSYYSPSRPGWQGLEGDLAQHFSLSYVSDPGLWTACGGQRRVWVPLAVSVWSPVFTTSLRTVRLSWVQPGTDWLYVCCWNILCLSSKITTLLLIKCTEITLSVAASKDAATLKTSIRRSKDIKYLLAY